MRKDILSHEEFNCRLAMRGAGLDYTQPCRRVNSHVNVSSSVAGTAQKRVRDEGIPSATDAEDRQPKCPRQYEIIDLTLSSPAPAPSPAVSNSNFDISDSSSAIGYGSDDEAETLRPHVKCIAEFVDDVEYHERNGKKRGTTWAEGKSKEEKRRAKNTMGRWVKWKS
ncbi:hypothetical protein CPB84DRAFT_1754973 [Gymnopilus junonius]|uniref:Uncharacterized protein n=1 Tax=Gymnopilus junonius TaxID=109634 RepID=A0A9P5N836_GYMJU|nr:hypothetical protein CPB84DRAFT_1754973 [Gymnopilus junonius]